MISVGLALLWMFGVSNRVLYKMALVPLTQYVFFLALLTSFTYSVIYGFTLYTRYKQGIVTKAMISISKLPFMFTGAAEAASQVLALVAAANLPGAILPLLSQSIMVWNLILASVVLGRRYTWQQITGALLVVAGVCVAVIPQDSTVLAVSYSYTVLYLVSMMFPALATIVKEKIFQDFDRKHGKPLDLFVVNTWSSISQGIFTILFIPILSQLRGIPLSQLPAYVRDGSQCFMGITPVCGGDCTGAPLLPLLYVAVNIVFNVVVLYILRTAGSLVLSLAASALVPFTIWAFTFNLPLLGTSAPLGSNFIFGASGLLLGLIVYNVADIAKFWYEKSQSVHPKQA
eukprot:TRINITY_DN3198_c0_g1_i1.p1 TRINITY_DN3198_c0_g1~~TRINITY_DN3198_c0_g1_i1.p1  ORF type:complete len:344 (+),score=26.20 TRINITY_DN3198_c0_g1_i1:106-1137(+)